MLNLEEFNQAPHMTHQRLEKARSTLRSYKNSRHALERRIVENDRWYRMRYTTQPEREETHSAWLFNSIANKHADAMDQFPAAAVLPREKSDERQAELLSAIIPVILDQNDYEKTYSDKWWQKLKGGTGVEGVFWNPSKANGLGDIDIRSIDLLNLFWEPGVEDIQSSRNLFHVQLEDNELLKEKYPGIAKSLGKGDVEIQRYLYDEQVDTTNKTPVVDWYYKVRQNGRDILHYCKFINDYIVYASEDDPLCTGRGFYDHGKYPFVLDVLYPMEGSPAGMSFVDIMKDSQEFIDRLNTVFLKTALMGSRTRFFIRNDGAVNEEEYADFTKDFVHIQGSSLGEESIRQINLRPLDGVYVQMLNNKVAELKETSGNRDFSSGGTAGGVTAASAIAALQEAGSKLSRDMIKGSYRAFSQICLLCIELIRQFYDQPRTFRLTAPNGQEFITYGNMGIAPQMQGQIGDVFFRRPEFDIDIKIHRADPFSRVAQNELARQFFSMGLFRPEMAPQALLCLEMMDFDGRDAVMERIRRVSEQQTIQRLVQ